jgi:glycosyltransferase involved in cell wall biosynthesis
VNSEMGTNSPKTRVTAIWSRDVDTTRLAGRTQIIQAIRRELSFNYLAEHLRVQNVLERRTLGSFTGSILMALKTLLTGRLPSLQCLLFCDFHNHRQLLARLRENHPDTLYCDGVRTFYLLKRMGSFRKEMRIVVDFDDLMSRRMQALSTTKTALSLGYLHDKIPRPLRLALALGVVSKFIARYEQAALTGVENLVGQWADVVVLVSQMEGQALRARYKKLGYQAQVKVIPPAVEVVAPPRIYQSVSRFIFIGTDALPQNKLTIQLLLDLWQLAEPELEIHLFGHMISQWAPVPGVVFRGYAPNLQDVYANGVVLVAPGVLRGGLKTKVAEAFAHGCAVVGNEITFEGMHLPDYPLRVEREEELVDILKFPLSYLNRMSASAESGQQYIRNLVNRQQFQKSWADVLR